MDKIDERNRMEKMKRSVIKFWRVHIVTPEEEEAQATADQAEAAKKANEVYERLMAEAMEDERRKEEEKQRAYEEAMERERGQAPDLYGSRAVESEEEQKQIEQILSEREARIERAFLEHGI